MAKPARKYRRTTREIDPRLIVLGAIGVIVVAIALMLATRDTSQEDRIHEATLTAQRAPAAADFTLNGVNGNVALADFRGQYVLVNFWATWCPPCMREMPDLYAYYQAHQNDNFILLGVNVGEDVPTVQQFLQANSFNFPVGLDEFRGCHGPLWDRQPAQLILDRARWPPGESLGTGRAVAHTVRIRHHTAAERIRERHYGACSHSCWSMWFFNDGQHSGHGRSPVGQGRHYQ